MQYVYVGLKRIGSTESGGPLPPKSLTSMSREFVESVKVCRVGAKSARWRRALHALETDPLFKDINVADLVNAEEDDLKERAGALFKTSVRATRSCCLRLRGSSKPWRNGRSSCLTNPRPICIPRCFRRLFERCPTFSPTGTVSRSSPRIRPSCSRHGRPDAELAGFVACSRHDSSLAGSADGNRLAPKLRIVPLFDGCVEGVHVDVDDLPLSVFVHRALVSLRPSRREP